MVCIQVADDACAMSLQTTGSCGLVVTGDNATQVLEGPVAKYSVLVEVTRGRR